MIDGLIISKRALRRGGALAFAAAACALAGAARADTLAIRYSIKLLGVPLGSATLNGTVDQGSYRLDAYAKLTGVATVVSNAKGAATASGIFVQGRVAPNGFATTSSNAQQARTIRIAMQAGNVRASEIVPPFESPPDRIPVLEAHKRNIIDPLSAMLMPVQLNDQAAGPAACNRVIPIFDGWTRFDVSLAYAGNREMKIKGYAGPVAVCGARYVPISGHRDRPVVKFMADNKEMDAWIAPIGESHIGVPLRMSVKTLIGLMTIEATDFVVTSASAQK